MGFYELYINGKNITKGPLAPYISNPEDVLYYDNYDITEHLNEGENVIGVLLGNGFRNAYGAFIWDFDKWEHRGTVTFALCMEAENEEKSFSLEADESFKTHPSPILYDDERMGYCYDARLEIPHWNETKFDDSNWFNSFVEKTPKGVKNFVKQNRLLLKRSLMPFQ